jgi:DNA-binding transcriptional MerR regulator
MSQEAAKGKTYQTAQIAKLIGVHPNTVRFYEDMKLLAHIPRNKSGYRVYTDRHLQQLRLLRTAFHTEILSDSLRSEVFEIVKTAASGAFDRAVRDTKLYLWHIREEKETAEEAIRITSRILTERDQGDRAVLFRGRGEAAGALKVTVDVLRSWERNGLVRVPKGKNGAGQYGTEEMNRLKIIRILRSAHYSMMSVLRMLNRLDRGDTNVREAIDTPGEEEDIVSAADRYITALKQAEKDALAMLGMLHRMQNAADEGT